MKARVDRETGALTIPTVQLSDIGIYNCTKRLSRDGNGDRTRVTTHQLSVISEPVFWLRFSINYETTRCNPEETRLIRKEIPEWIRNHACSVCEVHNASLSCSKRSSSPSYKVRGVISATGLTIQFKKMENLGTCSVYCLDLIHARIMELVRDAMIKTFQRPSMSSISNFELLNLRII